MPVESPTTDLAPGRVVARLALLGLLLPAELMALSLGYDALSLYERSSAVWFQWLGHAGNFAKILIVFVSAALLALGPRLRARYYGLTQTASNHGFVGALSVHLATYVALFFATDRIFGASAVDLDSAVLLPFAWILLVVLLVASWLAAVAPFRYWWAVAVEERLALGTAAIVALCAWFIAVYAQQLWSPMSEFTFAASSSLLGLVYDDVVVKPEIFLLGTTDFRVHVGAACSGYEGIGLVTVFTAFFLSVFRNDFRFPHALLLFPIGIATIWVFNAVRIALLITIGDQISPDIAMGGFHSQAGWISFILVAVGLLVFAYGLPVFSVAGRIERPKRGINLPMALLLPLVVLLSATLLTSALSADMDWLYPLRVVFTGAALIALWRIYEIMPYRPSLVAVGTGVGVFLLWIALVGQDAERDALVASQLQGASASLVLFWMVFRTIGSAITVPLAEELAFRGYLLGRLTSRYDFTGRLQFSWLALAVSSTVFGAMHGAWFAGTLAGLAYGLVRYHRDKVADAVVAHAITNLLLSGYVMATGAWSLW